MHLSLNIAYWKMPCLTSISPFSKGLNKKHTIALLNTPTVTGKHHPVYHLSMIIIYKQSRMHSFKMYFLDVCHNHLKTYCCTTAIMLMLHHVTQLCCMIFFFFCFYFTVRTVCEWENIPILSHFHLPRVFARVYISYTLDQWWNESMS